VVKVETMVSLFGKKDKIKVEPPDGGIPPMLLDLRETLYTRASLDQFLARIQEDAKSSFPWSNFVGANEALKAGDKARAISQLRQIHESKGLDTRIRLQCWHTLVSLGESPVETLRGYTQGVVVENHTKQGLDIVAAYSDHSARCWNYTGAGVIWDARDPKIDQLIFDLLKVGFEITKRIGIGLRDVPPVPEKGNVRIFIMAYDGSTVGEGRFDQLSKDPMGRVAIDTGQNLMKVLIAKRGNGKGNDVVVFRQS
jgi:hypothetical protein